MTQTVDFARELNNPTSSLCLIDNKKNQSSVTCGEFLHFQAKLPDTEPFVAVGKIDFASQHFFSVHALKKANSSGFGSTSFTLVKSFSRSHDASSNTNASGVSNLKARVRPLYACTNCIKIAFAFYRCDLCIYY